MAKEPEKHVRKKIRKPRKAMSTEQKAAAIERLAKAREKRLKENPPQYKNIHPAVLELDDEHPLRMERVKAWIKTQRELAAEHRKNERAGVKGATAKRVNAESYARSMQNYLESSTWTDMFYGEFREHRMNRVCTTMAYEPDGTPKRTYGVYYLDLGYIYGYSEERGGKPAGWNAETYVPEDTPEAMTQVRTQSNDLENFFE